MTFKKLKIKEFNQLKDIKINFERLTIITGDNGSGKTTLFNLLKENKEDKNILIKTTTNHKAIFFNKDNLKEISWTDKFKEYLKKIVPEINLSNKNFKEYFAKSEKIISSFFYTVFNEDFDTLVLDSILNYIDQDKKDILFNYFKTTNKQIILIENKVNIPTNQKTTYKL